MGKCIHWFSECNGAFLGHEKIRVAELFAGVNGFHLGFDGFHDSEHQEFDMAAVVPFEIEWVDQWKPDGSVVSQFA